MKKYLIPVSCLALAVGCGHDTPTGLTHDPAFSIHAPIPSLAFVDQQAPVPYGKFNGVEYVKHTGRFVGTTALGDFRVPYEIIAPANTDRGNGTVIVEPSHFALRTSVPDFAFGPEFVFGRGYSYAGIGWATFLLNILDPAATDAFIAGGDGGFDDEIVIQFAQALRTDPFPTWALPDVERVYAYGVSQTSFTMHGILRSPAGPGLLDFTMLTTSWWESAGFSGTFEPPADVGKVIVVQSEGDLVIADAEALRTAESLSSDWRVYEVAGAAHVPGTPRYSAGLPVLAGTNPVDWPAVARAMFQAGDAWVRQGTPAPASVFLNDDPSGDPDPFYGFPTGIARDADLNALGGVRFPDVVLGRAQYIAADFNAPPPIGALMGANINLECVPTADGAVRFPDHGSFVSATATILNDLVSRGFLLQEDARLLKDAAARSSVGSPGACP